MAAKNKKWQEDRGLATLGKYCVRSCHWRKSRRDNHRNYVRVTIRKADYHQL